MNISAFTKNIHASSVVCPTLGDRMKYLLWIYSNNALARYAAAGRLSQTVAFEFPDPIKKVTLEVRNNGGSDAFIFSEVFLHEYYNLNLPFSPTTILDLGSNIGLTAIYLSRSYPKAELACVEPMPNNIRSLRRNLKLNAVEAALFEGAVSVEDGIIEMVTDSNDFGHKVAGIDFGKSVAGEVVEVKAISVSTLMRDLNWSRIGLLKIDIEGYEAILLRGNCNWLASVDAICIECHEGYGETELLELAQTWGFMKPQELAGNWLLTRKDS